MNIQNCAATAAQSFYKKKDQPALDLLRSLTSALRTLIIGRQPVYRF
jgi:hypothetical protein